MKLPAALLSASIACAPALPAYEITAVREGRQVVIRNGDKVILRYQAEPGELPRPDIKPAFIRGGYLQSILTPAGRQVTDDFPKNHTHHHGVWNPWTKTLFEGRKPDFWNMGAETGRVEFVALDRVWQKGGRAGFEARHQFVDLAVKPPKVVLLETWEVAASVSGGNHVIDFTSTQTCATDSPLKLPQYHYGGLGFRGNAAWDGAANCEFLTASGLTDRVKVNTSRENWCWVGGKVDGVTCGVTLLGHPENFRHPQPIRAHPTEPFFCFAPQQAGDMEIKPGEPYVARYRLIVADGKPDVKTADTLVAALREALTRPPAAFPFHSMCNAYTVRPKIGAKALDAVVSDGISQLPSPLVRRSGRGVVVTGTEGNLKANTMRWGFHRAFSDSINNARSDKFGSPTWAESLRLRRCIVPISSFYEWRPQPNGAKQAFEFQRADDNWMWVAGLFEPSETHGDCFATITTEPPDWVVPIHDRMLAVLEFEDALAFLRGETLAFDPYPGKLQAVPCDSPLKRKPPEDEPQRELF